MPLSIERRPGWLGTFAAWLAALVTATVLVAAKEPDPIVLVHDAGGDLLTAKVRDELNALGWLVVEVAEESAHQPLEDLARRVHAFAGVHVAGSGDLELWVAPGAGPAFRERFRVDASDAEVGALRAVEVVRTRFLELGLKPPMPESGPDAGSAAPADQSSGAPPPGSSAVASGEHPPEEPARSPTPRGEVIPAGGRKAANAKEPSQRTWGWLGAAPGVAVSPGGLGGLLGASVELRMPIAARWSVGGSTWLPLAARTVESSLGSADVRAGLLLARAEYALLPMKRRVSLALLGGAGAALLHTTGRAQAPYAGRTDAVVAFSLVAGPALIFQLSRAWAVRAEALAGGTMPRPTVRFAGETVAAWGRPFGLATVGLELRVAP